MIGKNSYFEHKKKQEKTDERLILHSHYVPEHMQILFCISWLPGSINKKECYSSPQKMLNQHSVQTHFSPLLQMYRTGQKNFGIKRWETERKKYENCEQCTEVQFLSQKGWDVAKLLSEKWCGVSKLLESKLKKDEV
jgi:hypothetical protein